MCEREKERGRHFLPTVTEARGGSWEMTDGGDQIFCLDRVRIRDCLFMISPFWPTSRFSLQWKDRDGKSESRQPADNQITQGICGTFDQRGPSFYSKKLSDSVPKGGFVNGHKQEKSQASVRFLGGFMQVSRFCFISFRLILSPVSVPILVTRPNYSIIWR